MGWGRGRCRGIAGPAFALPAATKLYEAIEAVLDEERRLARERQGAPSARETAIGQGFPLSYRPDKARSAIYRTGLGPASCWDARCATIVGNQVEPSGESRLSSRRFTIVRGVTGQASR